MKRKLLVLIISLLFVFFVVPFIVGRMLTSPVNIAIGPPPPELNARDVRFKSQSGSEIHGWFIPGNPGAGTIVLMHGFRSNRLSMLGRARFLSQAGYSILLFDFQAHGESSGRRITVGNLESKDAQAAVQFIRQQAPGEKVGVIAESMGGAASILADPVISADAFVLEMVYPTIDEALTNRITMRLGGWSRILTPLLLLQLRLQTGTQPSQLRPIDHVSHINSPKLFIAAANDRHTPLEESKALYETASAPKEFWIVPRAAHSDLHQLVKVEYEHRVLDFFNRNLR